MVLVASASERNFDEDHTGGINKFGDIFGRLTNINLFIARVTDATYMDDTKKGYYLGQAYGLRSLLLISTCIVLMVVYLYVSLQM